MVVSITFYLPQRFDITSVLLNATMSFVCFEKVVICCLICYFLFPIISIILIGLFVLKVESEPCISSSIFLYFGHLICLLLLLWCKRNPLINLYCSMSCDVFSYQFQCAFSNSWECSCISSSGRECFKLHECIINGHMERNDCSEWCSCKLTSNRNWLNKKKSDELRKLFNSRTLMFNLNYGLKFVPMNKCC